WVQAADTGAVLSTGEPLAGHGAGVVRILAELGADAQTRASALLTVLPQVANGADSAKQDPMRKAFGGEIMSLVQGTRALQRLGQVATQTSNDVRVQGSDQKEMQRKMLLAMAADLRIVLMRLA